MPSMYATKVKNESFVVGIGVCPVLGIPLYFLCNLFATFYFKLLILIKAKGAS